MELETAIQSRRSIRKYKEEKVDLSLIEQCIQSAILAPSWKNSQTARYHVVEKEELLEKIKKEALPEFNANNVKDAPVLVITSFVKNRAGFERDGSETNECGQGWGFYDLGLHNMNFILKATELGLGTLVIGIRDEKKIREILGVDDNEMIVSVIAVGYKDIEPAMPKRKTVEDITKVY